MVQHKIYCFPNVTTSTHKWWWWWWWCSTDYNDLWQCQAPREFI